MDRRAFLAAGSAFALLGCLGKKQTTRSQRPDEKDEIRTIGEVTISDQLLGVPVGGIGLVIGLEGTGGGCPPGPVRKQIETYLGKRGFDSPRAVVDSKRTAVVVVSGLVMPGSRRNDRFDLELSLPAESKVKSLRGGYLALTDLVTYSDRNSVREFLGTEEGQGSNGNRSLLGSIVAQAEGPLHAPIDWLSERTEKAEKNRSEEPFQTEVRRGYVWNGGKCLSNRPYYLILNQDFQRAQVAKLVSERVNETFFGANLANDLQIAQPKNNQVVSFFLPPQYRLNLPHFLRVLRAIPLDRPTDMASYRRRLEDMLYEPATTLSAALRLEALGRDSVPSLKIGLESPYPLVRFACAESLSYLGETTPVKELGYLAAEHPALQAYALTALGSMDAEASSIDKLMELTASPSPELRYGAFRAMRECDPTTPQAKGEMLQVVTPREDWENEEGAKRKESTFHSFYLHEIPSNGPALVHLLTSRRAEIVLFGEKPKLLPGTSLNAGEFTVSTKRDQNGCTVSRFSKVSERQEGTSLEIADIIRGLARLGATYREVVEMVKQANEIKGLSCRLAIDALPRGATVKQLAEAGRTDPKMLNEMELLKNGGDDLSTTPTLYDRTLPIANENLTRGN
jgi:hypothetical protein